MKENQKSIIPVTRRMLCMNCWHQNDRESDAMWKLYSKDNKGIALRTDVNRLVESVQDPYKDKVFVGKVGYVDYFSDDPKNQIFGLPLFYKDLSYEHEKEVRAVIWDDSSDKKSMDERMNMFLPPPPPELGFPSI